FLIMFLSLIFYYHGCWFLGSFACALNIFSSFLVVSASVGNMVLISVDRYIAICDPMLYPSKVTIKRVTVCIFLCWIFSSVHAGWILRDILGQPDIYNSCIGECVLIVNYAEGVVDLVLTFFAPIIVITYLYTRVFVVAVSQARAMRSQITRSEMKAAKTLGVLIMVFLLCSCPYHFSILSYIYINEYAHTLLYDSGLTDSSGAAELWLIYLNSCVNPIIYAFCYPWFRRATKHIFTLKILQPGSSEMNIL
uniref:G-protein coupled receptors family 1 profile domain-containing protein n=1 Tax=Neogobius melanostomus TaxID=47308 RepID=A0A8C6TMB4_9GOBI